MFFGILNTIICLTTFVHLLRWRNFWGLCLPIGLICELSRLNRPTKRGRAHLMLFDTGYGFGFYMRYAVAKNPFSQALFIVEELFTVVSPAAFLAFNYIVYGRIMRVSVGDRTGFSLLKPTRVSTIFVISDVVTFLMQVRTLF